MPTPRINIEGQRFGRLVALHDVGRSKDKKRLWECLCDCGKFTVVRMGHLKDGSTKSCGCLQKELASGRPKLPAGEYNLNYVICSYKHNAKKRNLEFLLTKEQFKKLSQQDCFYCGAKPHNLANQLNSNGKFVYNGIDRIDNSKGYMLENCVACCGDCNWMKRDFTRQEFLAKIESIHNYMLKEKNGR